MFDGMKIEKRVLTERVSERQLEEAAGDLRLRLYHFLRGEDPSERIISLLEGYEKNPDKKLSAELVKAIEENLKLILRKIGEAHELSKKVIEIIELHNEAQEDTDHVEVDE